MNRKMKSLLIFTFFCLRASAAQDQKTITVNPGQTVTLPCRAPNDNKLLTGVEWSRPDLQPEYVLLLRDGHIIPDNQQPSFRDRAYLQDREGPDMSLILKDVSSADDGTYECQVLTPGRKREKRAAETISTINLRVVDPPAGGSVGLAVGVSAFAVVVLLAAAAAVGFVIYRKRTRNLSQASSLPPPLELQLLHHV